MAVSLDQFTKLLTDSGLMSADDLSAFSSSLPEQPADAESLARKLVEAKKLTPFQATEIWKGKTQQLTLGDYVILEKIGAGGMGEVYRAQHRRMKRVVALKVLPPAVTKDEQAIKRFEREVEAAARLTHPNIVTAYDAREDNGITYLVMECVEGKDLSAIVKKQGPATVEQSINCILQAAKGLEYAHKNGVIHRDIKPANLLFDREGTVKILDMGLARIDASGVGQDDGTQAELTSTGTIMGTVDYMSPEQAADTKEADARADIYSLGCSLWYLLTAKPVYAGTTVIKKIFAHKDHPIPSLKETRSEVPDALDAVFRKMVAKELADRYQTMTEVIADLEAIQTGGAPASNTSSPGIQPVAAGKTVDSGMASFLNNLDAGESATDQTVIAPAQEGKASDTFAESAAQLTKPGVQPTEQIVSKPLAKNRNLIVGGSVAAVVLLGALIWGFSGGEDDKPTIDDKSVTAKKKSKKTKKKTPALAVAPFDAAEAKAHQAAWADYLGVPVEYTNSIGMKFVLIPPGEFLMGSTPEEIEALLVIMDEKWREQIQSEGPQHKVILTQPIYLSETEVTQAQYEQVMETNPSHHSATGKGMEKVVNLDTKNYPVELVNWNDAAEFCAKLSQQEQFKPFYIWSGKTVKPQEGAGYRLPTEAEWEFACRAGTTTKFWSGDQDSDLMRVGWFGSNSGRRSHAVGELKGNPFGLYDIHGNVWEWVQDGWEPTFYGKFAANPATVNPSNSFSTSSLRVARGGDWYNRASYGCRSSWRRVTPSTRLNNIGFRVAMTIDTAKLKGSPPPPTDPDRAAAEWVLGIGGTVTTDAEYRKRLKTIDELPQQPFRVTQINLKSNKQVTDANLELLKGLTKFAHFYFGSTNISDAGLEHLKGLTNLLLLDLSSTQVSDAGLAHLKGMTKLDRLSLDGTQIGDAGLVHLKGLTNLTVLNLGYMKVSDAGLVHLKGLPKLSSLHLGYTKVSDAGLEHLKGLTKLTALILTGTKVTSTGVADLRKSLPNCKTSWDSNTDPDRAVSKWVLGIGGTVNLDAEGRTVEIKAIDALLTSSFYVVGINLYSKKQVSGQGLKVLSYLSRLSDLQLTGTDINDNDLEHLAELSSLRKLQIGGTNVTSSGMTHLRKMTGLHWLELNGLLVTDSDLALLEELINLETLVLSQTKITDLGLKHLTKLPRLNSLNLGGTSTSNIGMDDISRISSLQKLVLSETNISDEGLKRLEKLSKLSVLHLEKTKVTAAGVAELQKALPDCKITWDGAK